MMPESTKQKTQNPNRAQTLKAQNTNTAVPYRELEERTTAFARRIIHLCKALPANEINRRLISQIIRSAGSIGANYREANEATGKRDFVYRLRIARKETKETTHWLMLIAEANPELAKRMQSLERETHKFRNIFSAIIAKAGE